MVLGYIDPERFLGGDMPLDAAAAESAIREHVAAPPRPRDVEAAWGIFSIVNETMVAAARRYTAERAIDVRECTLITFGGAAPLHAWQVARILGVREILYPIGAGVTSAVGLCIAAPVVNISRSCIGALEQLDGRCSHTPARTWRRARPGCWYRPGASPGEIVAASQRRRALQRPGLRDRGAGLGHRFPRSDAITRSREVTERFAEPLRALVRTRRSAAARSKRSRGASRRKARPRSHDRRGEAARRPPAARRSERARVYFGAEHGFVDTPIYDRYRLCRRDGRHRPALMQERETTVVVAPARRWRIDEHMNLRACADGNTAERGDGQ